MFTKKAGPILIVRLHTGEDFLPTLQKAAEEHGIVTATVLSAVGMWKDAELGYFTGPETGYTKHCFPETCELLALAGNLSRQETGYNLHFHATLARSDGAAVGGHVFKATVHMTNEIFLYETGVPVFRRKEDTGLYGLYLE
jgi:predicted DNA-binding protein with PD1-like motif